MRLILLGIVLLGVGIDQKWVTAQKSALETIFDQLSMINRIVNAIALQNSAIHKTSTPRQFATEFLNVRLAEFSELIDLDLGNVQNTLKSYENTGKGSGRDPFENEVFNDMIRRGVEGIQRLEGILKANVSAFLDFKDIVISDVIACDKGILKGVQEFYEFHGAPEDTKKGMAAGDKMNKLKASLPGLISCLQNFKPMLQGSLKSSKIIGSLGHLKELEILETWVNEYQKIEEGFRAFDKGLSEMISDFQGMRGIWSREASSGSGGLLKHVIDLQMRLSDGEHVHEHLTKGFQKGPSDISKVVDDVKSEWFREKISRGKDIGPLVRALTPISKSSKFLEDVTDYYEKLHHLFTDNKELIKKTAENLEIIEDFVKQRRGKDTETMLSAARTSLGTCKPKKFISVDKTVISEFDKAYSKPKALIKQVEIIKATVEQVLKKFEISVLINALSEMEKLIKGSLTSKNGLLEYGKLRKSESFGLAEPIFGELEVISRAQEQAESAFEQLSKATDNTKAFKDLQDLMISTDMISTLKCFKTQQYDHEKIHKAIDFIHSVQQLSDSSNSRISEDYLTRIGKLQKDFREMEKGSRRRVRRAPQNPVLLLNDSIGLALHLGEGMEVLDQMIRVQRAPGVLRGPETYHSDVIAVIRGKDASKFWQRPQASIDPVIRGIAELEKLVPGIQSGRELMEIRRVLHEAEKVPGIPNFREKFENVPDYLRAQSTKAEFKKAMDNAQILKTWDLDFAAHKKTLNSAYLSLESISWYFDDVFGFKKKQPTQQQVIIEPSVSYWAVVGMCFGFFALCILVGFIGYGFTKSGRSKYWNTYLYYFPSDQEFEKRWRYSLFLDRLDGKNALIDASREVNPINTVNLLKKGAYVNVYSPHGNTPLHMATKRAYPEIVELLIANGADRALLNAQNKTPEQMIPHNYRETRKEKAAKYEKIEAIYAKYRNKRFRIRVPQVMPTHLFHIYIESRTEDNLTNEFMETWRSISSDEPLPTTTHCICKVNEDGHLETDSMDLLSWIFNGVIIVKESWMADCVRDDKVIREDVKYLVESVKYKGTIYENCVLPWSRAMAKGAMPYLYGVYVVVVIPGYQKMETISLIINSHGGTLLNNFPSKDMFTVGSHPYLHIHLGPIFIIHDGSVDLSAYQNDTDKMFTLFTEEEFIGFLLKRDIQQDTSEHPIPVVPEDE